jgi:putative membrane protein
MCCCGPEQRNENDALMDQKGFTSKESKQKQLATFLVDAVETRYAEIKLAELASTRSSNRQLVAFAQNLANDHTNTLMQLQALAEKKDISVPREESEETKKIINRLAKVSDAEFDERWCDEMLATHKRTIRDFEAMSNRTNDPDLKKVIDNSLSIAIAKRKELNNLKENLII